MKQSLEWLPERRTETERTRLGLHPPPMNSPLPTVYEMLKWVPRTWLKRVVKSLN
jgi:hypothetical protein